MGLGAAIGTSRLLVHWAKRVRRIDPEIGMSLIPEHIMRHVDVRYVVFGRTHEPVAMQLGGGRWYYNTGTWVPSSKPGVLRAFTHLVIRHGNFRPGRDSVPMARRGESRIHAGMGACRNCR